MPKGAESGAAAVTVRVMDSADEYYVGTCSHVEESGEIDAVCQRRLEWFKRTAPKGSRALVAEVAGKRSGFLYLIPIEICPWGPLGEDLMVIPCLYVPDLHSDQGVGDALLREAEAECLRQGRKGLVTTAYRHDSWFMPSAYFERHGFTVVRQVGATELLWKTWSLTATVPVLLTPHFEFAPVPGKVVIDLFWNTFCETSALEARRVEEVAAEFGDAVILRTHCADNRTTLLRYQIFRGIFVNGREIDWGHEAPRDGIREAIRRALDALTVSS